MKKYLLTLLFILAVALPLFAAEVKNIKPSQVGNRILFEFDVDGSAGEETDVSITLTIKGKAYTSDKLHLEGDFGKTRAGKGKKIYWNVLQDFPKGLSQNFDVEIVAGGKTIAIANEKERIDGARKLLFDTYIKLLRNNNSEDIVGLKNNKDWITKQLVLLRGKENILKIKIPQYGMAIFFHTKKYIKNTNCNSNFQGEYFAPSGSWSQYYYWFNQVDDGECREFKFEPYYKDSIVEITVPLAFQNDYKIEFVNAKDNVKYFSHNWSWWPRIW